MRIGPDRRLHPRFAVQPMYAPIRIRLLGDDRFTIDGNAYDISEGGLRFEADRAVAPGTTIAMQITLPSMHRRPTGPGRAVFVFANVVWLEDEDDPAPYKMAAVFKAFCRAGDQDRLRADLIAGQYRAAA